jgi:hypothetical protein
MLLGAAIGFVAFPAWEVLTSFIWIIQCASRPDMSVVYLGFSTAGAVGGLIAELIRRCLHA